MRRWLVFLATLLLVAGAFGALAAEDDGNPIRILMFTKTAGFRHGSIETAKTVMSRMAEAHGWVLTITEDASFFTDENLSRYDVVMFVSTTGSVLDQPYQREALMRFIQRGGGFVGVHAASDAHYEWDWYGDLVGAYFAGHPPGTQFATTVIENHQHPSTAHFGPTFSVNDEWYFWNRNPRPNVTVLMSLDRTSHPTLANWGGHDPTGDHPITWCQSYQGGRSWYTALGHNDAVWEHPSFQQMLVGAIEWAAYRVGGDC